MEIANQLITIFCEIDDFCKEFDTLTKNKLLTGPHPGKRGPEAGLSISEIMTILIMFHEVRFRDFKTILYWIFGSLLAKLFP